MKKHKTNSRERFNEKISKLISGGHISNMKSAVSNLITYEVEVDNNMFYSRVKNRIETQLSSFNIVIINDWRG
jgi:5-formaminoimidazole-4-carboxamide-1-beta-D-ribofuranosyl 5'-monophosphate synthetase